ncbi:IS66 family transposase [Marinobacterium rhizophilum]|uniref:IS66 family transposase n=1 Tax=Marinobacterium rhizophilum TaxID=420402 RepID=UPI003B846C5C
MPWTTTSNAWVELTRYLDDGALRIDNNRVEVRHEVANTSCLHLEGTTRVTR